MSVLKVSNVGKAFRNYKSEWCRVLRWLGLPVTSYEECWVLRYLSFEVQPGEAVGIVGQNGAGKSTLLKLITGTLKPSQGEIVVNGRISAILELGMGFSPELTGRENVIHSAGLMGFTPAEVEQLLPQIEEFAEIGDYFDEPIRTYSSGMQMRVAFAVATAKRPEILIVDEALSVGDSYFQHKSFRKIKEFREQGTTLLIVSHDRAAIQTLCNRAILLESGSVIKDGAPEEVMDFYNALIAEKENERTVQVQDRADGKKMTTSGTGEASVVDIAILNEAKEPIEYIDVGQKVTLRAEVHVKEPIERLVFGYGIRDRLGRVIYGTNTHLKNQVLEKIQPNTRHVFECVFEANLGPGSYSIQTALVSTDTHLVHNYEWKDLSMVFNVVNVSKSQFDGCAWIEPKIEISSL